MSVKIILRLEDVVAAVMTANGETNKLIAVKQYRNHVLEAAVKHLYNTDYNAGAHELEFWIRTLEGEGDSVSSSPETGGERK